MNDADITFSARGGLALTLLTASAFRVRNLIDCYVLTVAKREVIANENSSQGGFLAKQTHLD